jgi:hypothetical protein
VDQLSKRFGFTRDDVETIVSMVPDAAVFITRGQNYHVYRLPYRDVDITVNWSPSERRILTAIASCVTHKVPNHPSKSYRRDNDENDYAMHKDSKRNKARHRQRKHR